VGITAVAVLSLILQNQRQAAQYPGSILLSSHSAYHRLPYHFRWDDAYRTPDPFVDVYRWYSLTFDLGAESRANGGCIELDGEDRQFLFRRRISVIVCNTPQGQLVYVMRAVRADTAGLNLGRLWEQARP
jgi:hypothetical protein